MALLKWGNVYFNDHYVGRLQEEPGGRFIFSYDDSYLSSGEPAIAHTLPLQSKPFTSERGLHPYFDNLVAEGWLQNAQARALGVNPNNRFALLLGFGIDLIGAISIIDPEPQPRPGLTTEIDDTTRAALWGNASLSGIQRKLLLVRENNTFRPVGPNELSTHIAKLASGNLANLVELEHLSTIAVKKLLPNDAVVDTETMLLSDIHEQALIVPRFDRTPSGGRIHFEEFNQLLGHYAGDSKYNGSYENIAQFITQTPGCVPVEVAKLFRRILAYFIIGNTDAHFKNFAMFHTRDGLRLTPAYDIVSSAHYPNYPTIALQLMGIVNLDIHKLAPKHIFGMGKGFNLPDAFVLDVVQELGKRLPHALGTIEKATTGNKKLRTELIQKMEKRWNQTFKSTGQLLSKRQNKGEKNKR